jgi:transcriptional regulator with XRE-family HTH domain
MGVNAAPFTVPDDSDDRYIGTRLPAIIEATGIRVEWLARQSGLHRSTIIKVIHGKRAITPAIVEAVCGALRLPPACVFIDREEVR